MFHVCRDLAFTRVYIHISVFIICQNSKQVIPLQSIQYNTKAIKLLYIYKSPIGWCMKKDVNILSSAQDEREKRESFWAGYSIEISLNGWLSSSSWTI